MTFTSACVAVAEPLSRAAWLLPVTDLYLAARAVAHHRCIERCYLAVCVKARTISSAGDTSLAVQLSFATGTVQRLYFESWGNTDAVVVALPKTDTL